MKELPDGAAPFFVRIVCPESRIIHQFVLAGNVSSRKAVRCFLSVYISTLVKEQAPLREREKSPMDFSRSFVRNLDEEIKISTCSFPCVSTCRSWSQLKLSERYIASKKRMND